MTKVKLNNVSKFFGKTVAVDTVSLEIRDREFLTFLGPSGCGKTTSLRLIAGFTEPDTGDIFFGDRLVSSAERGALVPPEDRGIGMVFQTYALWPHMAVFDNVAFGLKLKKLPKDEIKEKVERALELVRLEGFGGRYPSQLSGGQQQRVALSRALVVEPDLLLLDEPLSNLDAKLREDMRFEIRDLQRRLRITAIYVTHDQAEAMVISDRLAVMDVGKVLQVGKPREVYEEPKTKFVADFIGLTNFISGEVSYIPENRQELGVVTTDQEYEIHCAIPKEVSQRDRVLISIRPENIELYRKEKKEANVLKGTVENLAYLGNIIDYRVKAGEAIIRVQANPELLLRRGETAYIWLKPEKCTVILG